MLPPKGITYATFRAGEVEKMTGMSQSRQRMEQSKGNLLPAPTQNNKAVFTIEHIAERALVGALIEGNSISIRQSPEFKRYFDDACAFIEKWAFLAPGAVADEANTFAETPLGKKIDPTLNRPVTVGEYAAHMRGPLRYALVWGASFASFSKDLRELTAEKATDAGLIAGLGRMGSPVCVVIDLKAIGERIVAFAGRPLATFTRPTMETE